MNYEDPVAVKVIAELTERLRASEAALRAMTKERDDARRFGEMAADRYNDLLETRVLTCAFCGEQYPPGTPSSQHELLTAHVAVCPRHPMKAAVDAARAEATKADAALRKISRVVLDADLRQGTAEIANKAVVLACNALKDLAAIRAPRPAADDGVIRFEDFEKRKPELIAEIRRSERLTGGDMATRIGTVPSSPPPPSEEPEKGKA